MKTQINPFLSLVLLVLISLPVFSQNQTDVTNIVVGKTYKIVLFDDTEFIGKIIAADSVSVSILTDNGSKVTIPRNNILYYTTDINPSKYSYQLALLGGASFLTNDSYVYEGGYLNNNKSGPNFNLSFTYFLSDVKAIKIDVGYTYLKANYDYYYYAYYGESDPLHQPTVDGGDIGMYGIKCNLLFGRFIPEERFQLSGAVGFGIHLNSIKSTTYTSYQRNYPDTSTWTKYTDYNPARTDVNALFCLGVSFGYRFSKHLGVRAEAEFDFISTSGIFFYGGGRNYFPVRAGMFYSF